jgi:hypothetical protein
LSIDPCEVEFEEGLEVSILCDGQVRAQMGVYYVERIRQQRKDVIGRYLCYYQLCESSGTGSQRTVLSTVE